MMQNKSRSHNSNVKVMAHMLPSVISVVTDGGRKILGSSWYLLLQHVHPRLNRHVTPAFFQDEVAKTHGDREIS
jgi:hypothetical protein